MATIFSKIIKGEIPCYKIAENDRFFAFLDISPVAKGHTLVIPKIENDYIFNLDDQILGEMMIFAKKVALAIENVVPCKRIGIAVIGLDVPHTHVHLVPVKTVADLDFTKKRVQLTDEQFLQLATEISNHVKL